MTKLHTIDAEYGYGYRKIMLVRWYYKIKFNIKTTIHDGFMSHDLMEKIFTIEFSDREINDEQRMLEIVKRSLSRDAMRLSLHRYCGNIDDEVEEKYFITPRALETFECLKTLVPKNVPMIENFIYDRNTQD